MLACCAHATWDPARLGRHGVVQPRGLRRGGRPVGARADLRTAGADRGRRRVDRRDARRGRRRPRPSPAADAPAHQPGDPPAQRRAGRSVRPVRGVPELRRRLASREARNPGRGAARRPDDGRVVHRGRHHRRGRRPRARHLHGPPLPSRAGVVGRLAAAVLRQGQRPLHLLRRCAGAVASSASADSIPASSISPTSTSGSVWRVSASCGSCRASSPACASWARTT